MSKDKKVKKKKTIWDKILLGAVIGGAIGSVLGAGSAPKKGKELREELVGAAKDAGKKSIKMFSKVKELAKKEKEKKMKKIPTEHE
jgi:gas vesicle protein